MISPKVGDKFIFRDMDKSPSIYPDEIVEITAINAFDVEITNKSHYSIYVTRCSLHKYLIPIPKVDNISISERVSLFCKLMEGLIS